MILLLAFSSMVLLLPINLMSLAPVTVLLYPMIESSLMMLSAVPLTVLLTPVIMVRFV